MHHPSLGSLKLALSDTSTSLHSLVASLCRECQSLTIFWGITTFSQIHWFLIRQKFQFPSSIKKFLGKVHEFLWKSRPNVTILLSVIMQAVISNSIEGKKMKKTSLGCLPSILYWLNGHPWENAWTCSHTHVLVERCVCLFAILNLVFPVWRRYCCCVLFRFLFFLQ